MIKSLCVVDIETTGLNSKTDMVCEFGLAVIDLDSGSIVNSLSFICNEINFKKINFEDAWIFQNSDLKWEDVKKARIQFDQLPEELLCYIDSLLALHPATAFNQDFDFRFLEDRGFEIYSKFFDPMLVLTDIIKIPHWSGFKWPSVEESWDFLFPTIPYIEKHRALDDAIHEAKIIKAIVDRYPDEVLEVLSNEI